MDSLLAFVSPQGSGTDHAGSVEQALACLDRFTAAFNAQDLAGMDAQLHFPHTMLSGAGSLVWPQAGCHPLDFFEQLRSTGWASTRYESRVPVLASADKVHLVVSYTRRSQQGEELSRHTNLWIVVRSQGTWGIALRSY
ncbi:hypothetical protein GCM10027082_29050 [Comamonas humi]